MTGIENDLKFYKSALNQDESVNKPQVFSNNVINVDIENKPNII